MGFGLVFFVVVDVMLIIVVNGREGAEEEATDIGENGGAAGRDPSFGEKIVENGERVVDALGPLEIVGPGGQVLAKVRRRRMASGSMARAEP